jgi:hypothetical protein
MAAQPSGEFQALQLRADDLETGVGGQLVGVETERERGVDTAGQIRSSSSH